MIIYLLIIILDNKLVILSNDLDNDIKLSKNYPNALKECRELNDNFYLKILKYLDSLN